MTASLQDLATPLGGYVNRNRGVLVLGPGIAPTIATYA